MSAPLPCWISTRPITPRPTRMCTDRSQGKPGSPLLSNPCDCDYAGRADGDEIGGHQRGAADQPAVDVRLGEKFLGVAGLDAAAVENLDDRRQPPASACATRARISACTSCACGRRRGLAGTDGPDRLVGDDRLGQRRDADARDHGLELARHDLRRDVGFALRQRLADADDRRQARRQRGGGLGGDHCIGIAVEARAAPSGRRSRSGSRIRSASPR